MKIEAVGKIKSGKLHIVNRSDFDNLLSKSKDCEVVITIEKKRSKRSTPQNRLYWGIYIKTVCDAFRGLGNDCDPTLIHEFLKNRFLSDCTVKREIMDNSGEVHEVTSISSAKVSKARFMDYLVQIETFASEMLNTEIPITQSQKDEIDFDFFKF